MQLTPEQKHRIKDLFDGMQTKEDLVLLLNYVRSLLFAEGNQIQQGKQKPIKLQTLTYYANTKLSIGRYQSFTIPKKSGGVRTLHAPTGPLKTIQRCINVAFQLMSEVHTHKAATGFVPGKSIADNARPHIGKQYVYNVDLKDFFPSIGFGRVKACLKLAPFNLIGEREPLAFMLANLCCERNLDTPKHSFLPQGAPTSPVLTNIICQKLDHRLAGLAKRFRLTYTRYADDLTFSSNRDVYKVEGEFCLELNRIITDQGFTLNPAKTRLQQAGYRQEVTGLIVNERVNVPRQYWREIRTLLHLWQKHGEIKAQDRYWAEHHANTPEKKRPALRNVLMGKLLYLRMVRGTEDALYQQYQGVYNALSGTLGVEANTSKITASDNKPPELPEVDKEIEFLKTVLQFWESSGLEQAASLFYKQSLSP